MPIAGLTDQERLPRLGKVRLGYIDDSRDRPFPRATDHFVVPPEVAEVYSDKPKELEPVFFPSEDVELFGSTFYRYYTQTYALTCKGNGQKAMRLVDMDRFRQTGEACPASHETRKTTGAESEPATAKMEVTCPCGLLDQRLCRPIMNLQFLLPNVKGVGIWQIDTSSVNSIRNVRGCIALIRQVAGRISGIPLRLSLVPLVVTPDGQTRKTVRVLDLKTSFANSSYELATYAEKLPRIGLVALPEPDDERPAEVTPTPGQKEAADEWECRFGSGSDEASSTDGQPPRRFSSLGEFLTLAWQRYRLSRSRVLEVLDRKRVEDIDLVNDGDLLEYRMMQQVGA